MTYFARPTAALDTRFTPASVNELKAHLRIDHSDQDALLFSKLKAATAEVENYIQQTVIARGFTLMLPEFDDEIVLRPGPALSVTSVKYYDSDNTQQTLDAANYELRRENALSRITPVGDWPTIYSRKDAVEIIYSAGLAASAVEVPPEIKEAVLMRAATRYSVTEEAGIGTVAWSIGDDLAVGGLLSSYVQLTC